MAKTGKKGHKIIQGDPLTLLRVPGGHFKYLLEINSIQGVW